MRSLLVAASSVAIVYGSSILGNYPLTYDAYSGTYNLECSVEDQCLSFRVDTGDWKNAAFINGCSETGMSHASFKPLLPPLLNEIFPKIPFNKALGCKYWAEVGTLLNVSLGGTCTVPTTNNYSLGNILGFAAYDVSSCCATQGTDGILGWAPLSATVPEINFLLEILGPFINNTNVTVANVGRHFNLSAITAEVLAAAAADQSQANDEVLSNSQLAETVGKFADSISGMMATLVKEVRVGLPSIRELSLTSLGQALLGQEKALIPEDGQWEVAKSKFSLRLSKADAKSTLTIGNRNTTICNASGLFSTSLPLVAVEEVIPYPLGLSVIGATIFIGITLFVGGLFNFNTAIDYSIFPQDRALDIAKTLLSSLGSAATGFTTVPLLNGHYQYQFQFSGSRLSLPSMLISNVVNSWTIPGSNLAEQIAPGLYAFTFLGADDYYVKINPNPFIPDSLKDLAFVFQLGTKMLNGACYLVDTTANTPSITRTSTK